MLGIKIYFEHTPTMQQLQTTTYEFLHSESSLAARGASLMS